MCIRVRGFYQVSVCFLSGLQRTVCKHTKGWEVNQRVVPHMLHDKLGQAGAWQMELDKVQKEHAQVELQSQEDWLVKRLPAYRRDLFIERFHRSGVKRIRRF